MMSFQGKLLQGGQVVLSQILGRLKFPTRGGTQSWSGHFALPQEIKLIEGGTYQLILDNGRSGSIEIDSVSLSGIRPVAYFHGLGKL